MRLAFLAQALSQAFLFNLQVMPLDRKGNREIFRSRSFYELGKQETNRVAKDKPSFKPNDEEKAGQQGGSHGVGLWAGIGQLKINQITSNGMEETTGASKVEAECAVINHENYPFWHESTLSINLRYHYSAILLLHEK
jgi:hypothetical protein